MTSHSEPASPRAKPGLARRGRTFFWMLTAVVAAACVAAWVALGAALWLDMDRGARLTLVVVAALATEALFWSVAAALGVTVFEARKRIWRRLTGRG